MTPIWTGPYLAPTLPTIAEAQMSRFAILLAAIEFLALLFRAETDQAL